MGLLIGVELITDTNQNIVEKKTDAWTQNRNAKNVPEG